MRIHTSKACQPTPGDWQPPLGVALRLAEERDAPELAAIYRRAVEVIGARHYLSEQIAAWLSLAPTAEDLSAIIADGRLRLVAVDPIDQPSGFVDLRPDGHLHYLYVDPRACGVGLGASLLSAAAAAARNRGINRIFAEASEAALGCFLRQGFIRTERREFSIGGVLIHNFSVERHLSRVQATQS